VKPTDPNRVLAHLCGGEVIIIDYDRNYRPVSLAEAARLHKRFMGELLAAARRGAPEEVIRYLETWESQLRGAIFELRHWRQNSPEQRNAA
jgi:hypothetical protein